MQNSSSLANLPKLAVNFKITPLPAVEANPLGFGDEVNICQTATCTMHDMERRKMQLYENGQLVKTRIYCGMYEKDTITDSTAREYCYISGGNGVTAVLINEELYFLRRDVQGTITGLIDKYNNLVEEYSYDACLSRCNREGRRRNPTDWTYDSVPQPQLLYRGYTMHVLRNTDCGSAAHRNPNVEQIPIMYNFYNSDGDYIGKMLDEFGLINMNGRCYDPVVSRFLSPDIIVQNPNNTQCYNRYSYAVNNPLKYTDPSGWSWTPIQAANHANMMAMTMTMRLQDNFQPSVIRSGSSSRGNGYLFGSNAIVFHNAEATLQMALGDIAHILSTVFGIPGLFGNPGDEDTGIDEQTGAENTKPPTVVNNSDSWSYVLTDDNKNYRIDAIPPGGKYFEKIDGVGTCLFDKFVFKAPSGAPITINSDCSVSIEGWESILDGFYYGWKDIYYFNDYDLNTNGWGDLFTALEVY